MMLRRREKRRYLTVLVKREDLVKLSEYSKKPNSQESNTSSANASNTVETKSLALTQQQQQQQSVSSFQGHNSSKLKNNKQNNFYSKKEEQQEIDPSKIVLKIIKKRFSELFGFIELEKSNIQTIRLKKIKIDDIFVVKCNLGSIDKLLFTLLMCKPPITTLKTSGTLRKLTSEIDSIIMNFNR
jgi:RNase P/RNase MRP subunit POP5